MTGLEFPGCTEANEDEHRAAQNSAVGVGVAKGVHFIG